MIRLSTEIIALKGKLIIANIYKRKLLYIRLLRRYKASFEKIPVPITNKGRNFIISPEGAAPPILNINYSQT